MNCRNSHIPSMFFSCQGDPSACEGYQAPVLRINAVYISEIEEIWIYFLVKCNIQFSCISFVSCFKQRIFSKSSSIDIQKFPIEIIMYKFIPNKEVFVTVVRKNSLRRHEEKQTQLWKSSLWALSHNTPIRQNIMTAYA